MEADKVVELLRKRLSSLRVPYVKAVLLFGSKARGEAEGKSDIDLLVLHDGCEVGDAILRRRHLYRLLKEVVGADFEDLTVIDMELKDFLKPREITPLLLNVYWDAATLHDETGVIERFLVNVRQRILKSGLKRVKDGKAYRWILPKPLREVKIL